MSHFVTSGPGAAGRPDPDRQARRLGQSGVERLLLFRVGGGFPQAARRTIGYGDLFYMIDPFDYQVAVETARAEVQNRAAGLKVKRAQAAPYQSTLGAHSV
jgi:hypothetical protein